MTAKAAALRDRAKTEQRMIRAVGLVLARDGFRALGVNAVAREAGVDKVLIYRYFGGLPDLVAAYGRAGDFWPSLEEMTASGEGAFEALPAQTRLMLVFRNFAEALRRRPITLEILAWEMVERNELTAILEEVRERTGLALVERLGDLVEAGIDVAALATIFGGAISYLAARARLIRVYNGIDLRTDEGWVRLERFAEATVAGLMAGTDRART